MLVLETLVFPGANKATYALTELEDCPLCHFSIKPEKLHIDPYWRNGKKFIGGFYRCTHCYEVFCTLSICENNSVNIKGIPAISTKLIRSGPTLHSDRSFDPNIEKLSPQFVKIYNQAFSAEDSGLDEIAGIGYRKALEFLTKDFCIHTSPDDEDSIKEMPLAACIKKYIDNTNINTLAEKAAWIGNDETHYVRKHSDRDISDLKKFIDARVYFVAMILITEDAESITRS